MAGITLAEASEQLTYWMGLNKILGPNSETDIDGTRIKRADVLVQITFWNKWVLRLSPRNSVRQVIPL